jgi:hypothetical protein
VPLARLDTIGEAWIQGSALHEPLLLYVTGGSTEVPVYVHLGIAVTGPVAVPRQRGVTARLRGWSLSVCIRAIGAAPVRRASLTLSFTPLPGVEPNEKFPLPVPAEGVRLVSMTASTGVCRP